MGPGFDCSQYLVVPLAKLFRRRIREKGIPQREHHPVDAHPIEIFDDFFHAVFRGFTRHIGEVEMNIPNEGLFLRHQIPGRGSYGPNCGER